MFILILDSVEDFHTVEVRRLHRIFCGLRKRGILAASEECLLAAMALNLKRMVNAIFFYLQLQCSAGTTVGFGRIFAFVNRS